MNQQVPICFKSARDGSQRRSRIDGVCLSLHLADVPAIDIEIPQKGNARHDVKGNLPRSTLNDVVVSRIGHYWPSEYRPTRNAGYIPFGADSESQFRRAKEIRIGEPHEHHDVPLKRFPPGAGPLVGMTSISLAMSSHVFSQDKGLCLRRSHPGFAARWMVPKTIERNVAPRGTTDNEIG